MRIYFIRHAEAVDTDDFDGEDMLRPLTKVGKKKAAAGFRRLSRIIITPELIVSSEALRATQTAEILKACMPKAKLAKSAQLNPGMGINGFRRFMKPLSRKNMTLAVVGHEPDLSRIVSHLVAFGKLDMRLKKGACAEVEVNVSGRGVLRSLLTLTALAGGE